MRVTVLSLLLALLTGCASHADRELIPFTDSLRARYHLSDAEIQRLQYYLSDRLELRRAGASGDVRVAEGRLVTRSERTLERVIVERGTPGIATAVHGNRLHVSFEEGTDFSFAPRGRGPESLYRLRAEPDPKLGQRVFLQDTTYRVSSDPLPYLLIDRETLSRQQERTRTLPGRTLR